MRRLRLDLFDDGSEEGKIWRDKVHQSINDNIHVGYRMESIRNWVHDLADDLMDQLVEAISNWIERPTTAHYNRVLEFMQKTGQDTPTCITIPDRETRRLRAKLILEETLETITALGFDVTYKPWKHDEPHHLNIEMLGFWELHDYDILDLIDGCTDIIVVTTGTLIAFGLPDIVFQQETDAANLRKFETPKCSFCDKEMWWFEGGEKHPSTEAWICPTFDCLGEGKGSASLPKRAGPYTRADGKHIKPPYWTPPNHKQHLEKLS